MNKALCLLLFLGTCLSGVGADPVVPQPDISFFSKLRMDYAQRKDFNPGWKLDEDRQAVIAAYQAKDYQKTVDLAEHWLARCPVDADVHNVCSAAATALGNLKTATHHLYFAYGLMESVTQSGDGLTPKTAFRVISVSEEYSLLREFGAQVTKQSLLDGPCDKMDCKFPSGKEVSLYFDVSIPFKAEQK